MKHYTGMTRDRASRSRILRASMNRLLYVIVALGIASAVSLGQTLKDNVWETNGRVYATAYDPGTNTLYIGGTFTNIGPNTGTGVPLDMGTGEVKEPFPKVNGTIRTVVPDGTGGWYIGGTFTEVGGLARGNVAHIAPDGTVDPDWGPNTNGNVSAIAVSGTTVYIGGTFSNIGGHSRNKVAAVDAATGVVTDWNPNANGDVRAIAVSGSSVYIAGLFTSIGGNIRNRLAALDAETGSLLGWNPNASGTVSALAISGSTMYVGGLFTSIGGTPRNNLAAVDATTGSVMGWNPGSNSLVWCVTISGSTVYVGGQFSSIGGINRNGIAAVEAGSGLVLAWNPGLFSPPTSVTGIAISGSTAYVCGGFTEIGGQSRKSIAALDATTGAATSWEPKVQNGFVNALAVSGSTVYAGGSFTGVGGVERNNIAAINVATGMPTSWNPSVEHLGGGGVGVRALALSGLMVYIGGSFSHVGGQSRNNLAAVHKSTGTVSSWNPDVFGGDVHALAVSGGSVYAGGSFWRIGGTGIGSVERRYLAAIDASTGNATGWDPQPNHFVYAMALSPTGSHLYIGGLFTNIGGSTRNYLAQFSTISGGFTAWNPVVGHAVYAIAVSGPTVYVGGDFSSVGGQPRSKIAAIDAGTGAPTSWSPNANTRVYALDATESTVYAGGLFTSIGGQSRKYIASIDASTGLATGWNPQANYQVLTLAVTPSVVYVGGDFNVIDNKARNGFTGFLKALNVIPVAQCKDVTVSAGASCTADVDPEEMNDGSFDPDGGPVSFTLDPPGPYPLGETSVTLTVTDDENTTASCSATVTVEDTEAPVITPLSSPIVLVRDNINNCSSTASNYVEFDVSDLHVAVSDNCGATIRIASVSSDEPDDAPGSGDGCTEEDIDLHDCDKVELRRECDGGGSGRVYRILLEARDGSGNTSTANAFVYIKKNPSSSVTEDSPSYSVTCGAPKPNSDQTLIPMEVTLSQNYPNPFNPSTSISFGIPENTHVNLKVFDVHGRLVSEMVNEDKQAGSYSVSFDASKLPSGVYLYRLEAGGQVRINTMTLMK